MDKVTNGPPAWWNDHGHQMAYVAPKHPHCNFLLMRGTGAELTISRTSDAALFLVRWKLLHGRDDVSEGTRLFRRDDVEAAFSLSEAYGRQAMRPGYFRRHGDFVNIPCAGIGEDGDPNISIEIDDEMRDEVRKFIESA